MNQLCNGTSFPGHYLLITAFNNEAMESLSWSAVGLSNLFQIRLLARHGNFNWLQPSNIPFVTGVSKMWACHCYAVAPELEMNVSESDSPTLALLALLLAHPHRKNIGIWLVACSYTL